MNDLLDAFDALVSDPPVSPEPIETIERRAQRWRRRRRAVGVIVTLAIAAPLALGLVIANRAGRPTAVETANTTATSVTTIAGTATTVGGTNGPPFTPPGGYLDATPRRMTVGGTSALTYSYDRPGDPMAKKLGSSLAVTLLDAGQPIAGDTPVAFANRFTNRTDFVEIELDGRRIARQGAEDVLSGAPFGAADRHGVLYVFQSGRLAVEISAQDVSPDEVRVVVASFDAEAAERAYRAK